MVSSVYTKSDIVCVPIAEKLSKSPNSQQELKSCKLLLQELYTELNERALSRLFGILKERLKEMRLQPINDRYTGKKPHSGARLSADWPASFSA